MTKIFLNYRRDDSAGHTGHLYAALSEPFGEGNVFRDLDNIPAGSDFAEHIESSISECDAVIVVIGSKWLAADQNGKRRIDNPRDYVRLEIRAAMNRGIRIVPVLVDGAKMPTASSLPKPLAKMARFQAQTLTDAHWQFDVQKLVQTLGPVLSEERAEDPPPVPFPPTASTPPPPAAHPTPEMHNPETADVPAFPQTAAMPPLSVSVVSPPQVFEGQGNGIPPLTGQVVRTFSCAGADLSLLLERLVEWLRSDRFEVQLLNGPDSVAVQARQPQKWRQTLGMSTALTIVLRPHGNELTVQIGGATWADKVAVGAVGMLIGIGAITPIVGAWTQKKYPEKVFAHVQQFLDSSRGTQGQPTLAPAAGLSIPPPPPPPPPTPNPVAPPPAPVYAPPPAFSAPEASAVAAPPGPGAEAPLERPPVPSPDASVRRFCESCGTQLSPAARFCAGCGNRVHA